MSQTKILVVGGEVVAAKKLAEDLHISGYDVIGVISSGTQALQVIEKDRPDLVLLDIHLEGELDGIDIGTRLYRDFNVPVIFLTEHSLAETLDRAASAEPFGYLTKPLRLADLAGAITIALRKHSVEQKLREREVWLTSALRAAGDAVVVTDASGRIGFLNPLAKQLLSVPDVDVTGLMSSEVIRLQNKITATPVGDMVQLAILQGSTMDAGKDLIVVNSAGESRDVEGEISVCRVENAIVGTVFTFRDVTLRNQREEQLRREIRGQAVAQLAGAISSQVTTLLKTALTHSEEALNGIEVNHQSRSPIEAIKTRVEDMSRIASQLFALSSNRASFPRVLDLNAEIVAACDIVRQQLPPEITLTTDLASDLGEIRVDPADINSAITRLAAQASADLPKGSSLGIKTRNYALERRDYAGEVERYIILTIGNIGSEIAGDTVELLPTYNGAAELDLGLFLVQGIITDAQGSMTARTNPNGGITFEVLLPQAAVSRKKTSSSSEEPSSTNEQESTVLLVEADAGVRKLIIDRLERDGYEVLGAANYADSVGWLDSYEGTIAMLITNLIVNETNGSDLARQVLLRHPALKTVFISDGPVEPSLQAAWTSQAATFIEKPFEQDQLVRIVHGALNVAGNGVSHLAGIAAME